MNEDEDDDLEPQPKKRRNKSVRVAVALSPPPPRRRKSVAAAPASGKTTKTKKAARSANYRQPLKPIAVKKTGGKPKVDPKETAIEQQNGETEQSSANNSLLVIAEQTEEGEDAGQDLSLPTDLTPFDVEVRVYVCLVNTKK